MAICCITFKHYLKVKAMESLANLESFVRAAEFGGFSAAARRLGLTPAAVSRNVAQLEANLGVRLFQRSTRRLTLTEAGERFLASVRDGLESVQAAIASVSSDSAGPAGVLKVSMGLMFGLHYILPMLPDFLARYPHITPDWHFDNRPVDLVGEGFDAAIGGGFDLTPGVVARELTRVHIVAVAAPSYLRGRGTLSHPRDLAALDGILLRSPQTSRVRTRVMRNRAGEEAPGEMKQALVVSDPEAMCRCAVMGLGIGLVALPLALPHLESGALVRVLPEWWAEAGATSIYFSSKTLMPAKTRVFVDFVVERFRRDRLAERFSAF
jgi:DNA-binding transcriptional LysR family regulator